MNSPSNKEKLLEKLKERSWQYVDLRYVQVLAAVPNAKEDEIYYHLLNMRELKSVETKKALVELQKESTLEKPKPKFNRRTKEDLTF